MHNPRLAPSLRVVACSLCLLAWGSSAAAAQQARHTMGLPGSGWAVALELPGFDVLGEQTRSDGQGRRMEAFHPETGVMLSLFVEREPTRRSTEECRDLYWNRTRRSPLPKRNVRTTERPPLSVMEYLVPSFQGRSLMQQNVNAYYGQDGICVDLHVSKTSYVPADSALFAAILRSVRITSAEESPAQTGKETTSEGGSEPASAEALAEIAAAEEFGRSFVTALQRDGVAGILGLLTPATARDTALEGSVAGIRSILPPDAAKAMQLVEMEQHRLEGAPYGYSKLVFALHDSRSVERVQLWLKVSGGERRVQAIRVAAPSGGREIVLGSEDHDLP